MRTEWVDIDSLVPDPRNPRNGDLDMIEDSIRRHGIYRSIVAHDGSNQIIAGHHAWMAAKATGERKVLVDFLDVDDEEGVRIGLHDNRTADMATHRYDTGLLVGLLQELPDLSGTGYSDQDLSRLMADPPIPHPHVPNELGDDFSLVVECGSEPRRQDLLARLEAEGYACQVLVIR